MFYWFLSFRAKKYWACWLKMKDSLPPTKQKRAALGPRGLRRRNGEKNICGGTPVAKYSGQSIEGGMGGRWGAWLPSSGRRKKWSRWGTAFSLQVLSHPPSTPKRLSTLWSREALSPATISSSPNQLNIQALSPLVPASLASGTTQYSVKSNISQFSFSVVLHIPEVAIKLTIFCIITSHIYSQEASYINWWSCWT